ncbi:hypothetical protein ACFWH4_22790 [Streptomyces sp. NPDC127091]|uniref:hypothetical protein n=1 Tax=Streptomyces sp. NPDC127091 TaxID=3347134 RepID=UPI00366168A1
MPADEVTRGTDGETFRVRTGPRHAAPKKPLFTRLHMPAGKAIALAAMPTAVLMGMGFTPTLAQAEDRPQAKNLTADEYKDCLKALEESEDDASSPASDTAAPSPGADATTEPSPSASAGDGRTANPGTGEGTDNGSSSSPPSSGPGSGPGPGPGSGDSGDEEEPAPAPSAASGARGSGGQSEPAPTPSETGRNLLEDIGDAVKDVLTPQDRKAEESPSPTPSASAVEAVEKATEAAKDTAGEAADTAAGAAEGAGEAAETPAAPEAPETPAAPDPTDPVTTSPSPSASAAPPAPSGSAATDLDGCPIATDAEGGVDNRVPLPEDPWFLNASSLLLRGADYRGIVEVRTASGKVKKVLKYVVSDGTDIGDLHQTVEDRSIGKTHHVQAAKGSMSTIRDGDTVMYTERISGKLLGLIPVTFDPENPPPLNIPLIYFTDVTVQQAGQFGGTLHVPGLRQYVT